MAVPDLVERYDVEMTVDYIVERGYRRVALQFPDELLPDSPAVSQMLQQKLGERAKVFILADTAYNPLGVDEVAAQHLAAQCVIHYGRASLVPVNSLPAFFVFPKEPLDVPTTAATVSKAVSDAVRTRAEAGAGAAPGEGDVDSSGGGAGGCSQASGGGFAAVMVLLDQGYQHRLQELRQLLLAGGEAAGGGAGGVQAAQEHRPPWIFARVTARSLAPEQQQQQQAVVPRPAPSAATVTAAVSGCCRSPAAPDGGGSGCAGSSPGGGDSASECAQRRECCAAAGGGVSCAGEACATGTAVASPMANEAAAAAAAATQPVTAPAAARGTTEEEASAKGGPHPLPEEDRLENGEEGAEPPRRTSASGHGCSGGSNSSSCSTTCSMAGLKWELPPGAGRRDCLYVWIGPTGSSAQQVLQLTHSTCEWLSYDPAEGESVRQGLSDDTRRLLKRRNFMVEKARAANIVGLLVGTLGSAGFREVISSLRRLAVAAGKKTYTFLMGKPNPAKLGNFPEVDVWVMVSDAQGLLLDCRDYLAPLVTPWEAATAFLGGHLDPEDYRMEMGDVMDLEARQQQQQHTLEADGMALQALGNLGLSVATRGSGDSRHEVVARTAAEFLALKRTFKGLEMPATGASRKAPELAVEGLSGRAAVYADEGGSGSQGGAGSGTTSDW